MSKGKKYFIFKLLITIFSGLFAVLIKSKIDWPETFNIVDCFIEHLVLKEVVYDISIGVFSAMILVWAIDEITDKIKERKSKEIEYDSLNRINILVQKYLSKYERCFYCVVTPLTDRTGTNQPMSSNFTLRDMRDLFQPSLLSDHSLTESSIFSFLDIELQLRQELISIVKQNSFEHYTEFIKLFDNYIVVSLEYDCRMPILEAPNKMVGDKKMTDLISQLLRDDADRYRDLLLQGKESVCNIMYPYVLLFELMQKEYKIIVEYKRMLNNQTNSV